MVDHITRRHFHHFMAAGAAAVVFGPGIEPAMALETATITWTSDDPHLSGNYAPIGPEIDTADLPVIAGRIPPNLSGAYMRNGPNPLYKPLAFTYPMDGDGMIHAVYFDNGRARYRNRFVQTPSLAGRAPGRPRDLRQLRAPGADRYEAAASGRSAGPVQERRLHQCYSHGGHLLALNESTTSFEITRELDTVGEWKAGTDKPLRLGAHNRRHPETGALFAIDYSHAEPTVQIHQIDASGNLVNSFPVALAAPTMIHDFVLTERYIVLLVCPAVFDSAAAQQGQSFLQWRPGMGTRIGLIALDGSTTQWLDADPFFVFHFANAFERGGNIFIDYVQHESLALGYAQQTQKAPTLHRMTIDLVARKVSDAQVAGMVTEFPRVNDALGSLPTRFVYLPTLTETLRLARPPSATFNSMMKVNTETGDVLHHDFGNKIAGEAVFIPRGTIGEDDGYLAIYAFDQENETSDLVLLDAAHIDADPVAVIRLPQRVPQGLHGNWIPKA
ncbi:MAG: carotenoid oxygenase family protein [Caulobacteraceae bacterium]